MTAVPKVILPDLCSITEYGHSCNAQGRFAIAAHACEPTYTILKVSLLS